jgi:phosphate transport system substrate-binding protein
MYTKGEPKEVAKAYLDYMVSSDAKQLVDKLNYIPVSDMKVSR